MSLMSDSSLNTLKPKRLTFKISLPGRSIHPECFIQKGIDAQENVNLHSTVCGTNTSTEAISAAITPYYLRKLQWSPLPHQCGPVPVINHSQLAIEAEWRLGGG